MKFNFTYFFALCISLFSSAQQQNFELTKGNCVLYRNNIYAYGFRPGALCLYKHDLKLNLVDSAFYVFSDKSKSLDYLGIDIDTLHQTLNFYLQKRDKLKATLVRFNDQLKIVNEFKNIEITKLNPLADYDQQKFVFKNYCYVVKTVADTSGLQYYLSKFELLKSTEKPFDYKFIWQFNFEKKYIQNITVFYADTNYVLAYVDINNGDRKGQWLLKINAGNGLIIKGKRISPDKKLNYHYSNFIIDTTTKDLFILGQLTVSGQVASASPTLFILQYDSMLAYTGQKQIIERVNPANPKSKTVSSYLFQIVRLKTKPNSDYEFEMDMYKNYGNEFKYFNSYIQAFSIEGDEIVTSPEILREYPEIENYYFSQDKKDLNGKLFNDTTSNPDRLFYVAPVFPVKVGYKLNVNDMPVWLLKKSDIKTQSINYSVLQPGLKIYELKTLQNLSKDDDPNMILLTKSTFLIYSTKNNSVLHLELGAW